MLTTQNPLDTPSVGASQIQITGAELAVTATLLICVASMWTMALGDPELIAIVACVGIVTVLLAWVFLFAYHHRKDR